MACRREKGVLQEFKVRGPASPEKMEEKMKFSGRLLIELRDKNKKLKDKRVVKNIITEVGDAHVADQMSDRTEAVINYMAVGTGTTAAAATDTALEVEIDRNVLTSKTQGTGVDDNDVIYVCDFGAGEAVGAITEAGLFNSDVGGVMLCRTVFAAINKTADDSLKLTWRVTFGAS